MASKRKKPIGEDSLEEVECEFCTNRFKVNKFANVSAIAVYLCKECMKIMLARWRETGGIWDGPYMKED